MAKIKANVSKPTLIQVRHVCRVYSFFFKSLAWLASIRTLIAGLASVNSSANRSRVFRLVRIALAPPSSSKHAISVDVAWVFKEQIKDIVYEKGVRHQFPVALEKEEDLLPAYGRTKKGAPVAVQALVHQDAVTGHDAIPGRGLVNRQFASVGANRQPVRGIDCVPGEQEQLGALRRTAGRIHGMEKEACTRHREGYPIVAEVMQEHYNTTGEVMAYDQAAEMVEKHFESELDIYMKAEKTKQRAKSLFETVQEEQKEQSEPEESIPSVKAPHPNRGVTTLTNTLAAGRTQSDRNGMMPQQESLRRAASLLRWN